MNIVTHQADSMRMQTGCTWSCRYLLRRLAHKFLVGQASFHALNLPGQLVPLLGQPVSLLSGVKQPCIFQEQGGSSAAC